MNSGILAYNADVAKEAGKFETLATNFDREFHKKLIKTIGEPLIRKSLEDLYKQAFPIESKGDIQMEIDRLIQLRDNMN